MNEYKGTAQPVSNRKTAICKRFVNALLKINPHYRTVYSMLDTVDVLYKIHIHRAYNAKPLRPATRPRKSGDKLYLFFGCSMDWIPSNKDGGESI